MDVKKEKIKMFLMGGLYKKYRQPIFYLRYGDRVMFYDGDRSIDGYILAAPSYEGKRLERAVKNQYMELFYSNLYMLDEDVVQKFKEFARELYNEFCDKHDESEQEKG